MSFNKSFLLILVIIACSEVGCSSSKSQASQEYYLSELEYELVDMDSYLLDYYFNDYSSTCNRNEIQIESNRSEELLKYIESSLQSSIQRLIIFANQQSLKINGVALLKDSSLLTFVDDASATSDTLQKLENLQIFPIPNVDSCYNLIKVSSISFLIECSSQADEQGKRIITLQQYTSQTGFSATSGIDLSNITPTIITLNFNPLDLLPLDSSTEHNLYNSQASSKLKRFVTFDTEFNLELIEDKIENPTYEASLNNVEAKSEEKEENRSQNRRILSDKLSEASQQEFLNKYYSCYKEGSFYENSSNNIKNYFKICKYHETNMKTPQDSTSVSSFIEYYDLTSAKNGVVEAVVLKSGISYYEYHVQGVQQFSDNSIICLDFNEGLFLFTSQNPHPKKFKNVSVFIKYLYDQKYLNLFQQINKNLEFTIQDAIPNYLIINTQGYLLYYSINPGVPVVSIDPYPKVVSISHFIDQVQQIHETSNQSNELSSSNCTMNIENLIEVKYDFDPFVYYISIKYAGTMSSQYLLINRSLTDYTSDIAMNHDAIEMDYTSKTSFSTMSHYMIPGVFCSYVRSRVRIYEIDGNQGPSQNDSLVGKMAITTFSWMSSQILKLYTQLFDVQSSCSLSIEFNLKTNLQIYLIPRTFKGIISKNGLSPSLVFSNPQPYFSVEDWFFGSSLDFSFDYTGSSLNAHINVIQSTSSLMTQQPSSYSSTPQTANCVEAIVGSMQISDGYYIFHQTQSCSLWFQNCQIKTQYNKIKFGSTQTVQPNQCMKSSETPLSQKIQNLLFDGTNVLISYVSTEGSSGETNNKGYIFFSKVSSVLKINKDFSYQLSIPSALDLGENLLNEIKTLQVFVVPNTKQFGVIIQSTSAQGVNSKNIVLFEIQQTVKGISLYEFTDDSMIYDGFETSLLDQGILFATLNQGGSISPQITVFQVNFQNKQCTTGMVFSQQNIFNQIQNIQAQAITSSVDVGSLAEKGIFVPENANQLMNDYQIRIWRNNETSTYRMLMVDYGNNCLLDFFLYDLIQPIFVRQVDLFDFQFIQKQNLQITNNMVLLNLSRGTNNYLVPLEINGESINQIKKMNLISATQQQSVSQIVQGQDVKYQEGLMCLAYTSPTYQINCIFEPFILLKFDYSATADANEKQSDDGTADKKVNFNFVVKSMLPNDNNDDNINAISKKDIILQTDFTNFDTNLLTTSSTNIKQIYTVSSGISIRGEQTKTRYLPLDTSFVSGSIESFSFGTNQLNKQTQEKYNLSIQGYIDIAGMKSSTFPSVDSISIDINDKNLYQLVCLSNDGIDVINQNLKFNFSLIFTIKFSEIQFYADLLPFIQHGVEVDDDEVTQDKKGNLFLLVRIQSCSNIYSGEVQSSQATSTYQYLMLCQIYTISKKLQLDYFITFKVDVNQFSSLEDQAAEWKKALKSNIKLVDIKLSEEYLNNFIDEIDTFSIASLTDKANDIGGYLFFMVRKVQEVDFFDSNIEGDYKIYVLWEQEDDVHTLEGWFVLNEINQINSSDLSLNNLIIKNFVGSFPQNYPNQLRYNSKLKQNFVFNIGWDDGQRYVIVALLKLTLPPNESEQAEKDELTDDSYDKKVFQIQFQDIYGEQFSSFIKNSETWRNPLTPLQSTITFNSETYNVSILITNQFSIVELSCILSPFPFLEQLNDNSTQSVQQIIAYTQYAWCENQFSNDFSKQQILKYQQFLIIQCRADKSNSNKGNEFQTASQTNTILKIYVANQNTETVSSNSQISQKNYSMVQSIPLDQTKLIKEMYFRSENKQLSFYLILGSYEEENYELYQYPVNSSPIIVYPADILDNTEVQICASNKYETTPCTTAVFSNVIINTRDLSLHQWLLFGGLIALPLFITIVIIFASFLRIKKLRKKRQDEFIELLQNSNEYHYKSKSDLSPVDNSPDGQEKYLQMVFSAQEDSRTSLTSNSDSIFKLYEKKRDSPQNVSTNIK